MKRRKRDRWIERMFLFFYLFARTRSQTLFPTNLSLCSACNFSFTLYYFLFILLLIYVNNKEENEIRYYFYFHLFINTFNSVPIHFMFHSALMVNYVRSSYWVNQNITRSHLLLAFCCYFMRLYLIISLFIYRIKPNALQWKIIVRASVYILLPCIVRCCIWEWAMNRFNSHCGTVSIPMLLFL